MKIAQQINQNKHILLPGMLLAIATVLLICGLYYSSWQSLDWGTYRTAALRFGQGISPYLYDFYFNPPWTLLPLLPFALLPAKLGSAMVATIGLFVYALIARHFGTGKLALVIFLLSPPVLYDLYATNINWLAFSGVLMPPWLGLFFVMSKPQVGIGIACYWLVEAWRIGGWRQVLRTFAPVTAAYLISFAIYGFWFRNFSVMTTAPYNMSLGPAGIVLGALILGLAIYRRQMKYAVASSPLFSPYFNYHSWSNILIGLMPNPWLLLLADFALIGYYLWFE